MASEGPPLRSTLEEAWKAAAGNHGSPTLDDLRLFDLPIGRDRFARFAAGCEEAWRNATTLPASRPGAGVNVVEASKLLKERFAQFNRYLEDEMLAPLDFFKMLRWAAEPATRKPGTTGLWDGVWEELYLLVVAHGYQRALGRWRHSATTDAAVHFRRMTATHLFDRTATFVPGSKDWGFHPKDAEVIYSPWIHRGVRARPNSSLMLLRARLFLYLKGGSNFQEAQTLRRAAKAYAKLRGLDLLDEIDLAELLREVSAADPLQAANRRWHEIDRHYQVGSGEKGFFTVFWINPSRRSVCIEMDAFPGQIFRTYSSGKLTALARDHTFRLVAQTLNALGDFLLAYLTVLGFVVDIITAGGASVTLRGFVYTFLKEKLIEAAVDRTLDTAKIDSLALRTAVHLGVGMKTATAKKKLLSADELDAAGRNAMLFRPKAPPSGAIPPSIAPLRPSPHGAVDHSVHITEFDPDTVAVVPRDLKAKIQDAAILGLAKEEDVLDDLAEAGRTAWAKAKDELSQIEIARGTTYQGMDMPVPAGYMASVSLPRSRGLDLGGVAPGRRTRLESTRAKENAQRFVRSRAYESLDDYRDFVDPRQWTELIEARKAILQELVSGGTIRSANKKLRNIINNAKEFSGEEMALVDVFSRHNVEDYLSIPRRGKRRMAPGGGWTDPQGAPMLDVAVRLKKGEPYQFVLIEAKGSKNARMGQGVTRKTYKYEGGKLVGETATPTVFERQGTGPWYFQKFAEIYIAGQGPPPDPAVMSLAVELMDAARAGKIRFQVIKASPDLVRELDDTVAMTTYFGQKMVKAPRGGLPIPHSLAR